MPSSPPDLVAGESLSPPCAVCHGPNGIAKDPSIPSIASCQQIDYPMISMMAYTTGERESEAMAAAVTGLSEYDIRYLAAFHSALELPAGAGAPAGGTEAAETAGIQDPVARAGRGRGL